MATVATEPPESQTDTTDDTSTPDSLPASHERSPSEPTCAYCGRLLDGFARVDFLPPPLRRSRQRHRPRDRGTWRSRVRPERG